MQEVQEQQQASCTPSHPGVRCDDSVGNQLWPPRQAAIMSHNVPSAEVVRLLHMLLALYPLAAVYQALAINLEA